MLCKSCQSVCAPRFRWPCACPLPPPPPPPPIVAAACCWLSSSTALLLLLSLSTHFTYLPPTLHYAALLPQFLAQAAIFFASLSGAQQELSLDRTPHLLPTRHPSLCLHDHLPSEQRHRSASAPVLDSCTSNRQPSFASHRSLPSYLAILVTYQPAPTAVQPLRALSLTTHLKPAPAINAQHFCRLSSHSHFLRLASCLFSYSNTRPSGHRTIQSHSPKKTVPFLSRINTFDPHNPTRADFSPTSFYNHFPGTR